MSIFGKNLRKLRKDKKLSGQQLADILGVTKVAVHYWETTDIMPGSDMLDKIASYFKVTTDYLLGRIDVDEFIKENNLNEILDKEDFKIFIKGNPTKEKIQEAMDQLYEYKKNLKKD